MQSARMASEIHKKRTGKGFKISEEIVIKEEMYEEEEDDLPRHYRALAAHLQTSSEDMNSRLNAYITNQVAMRTLARHQEVNRMFSESFPNASQMSQNLVQSVYFQPLAENQCGPAQPHNPQSFHPNRSQSTSSHTSSMSPRRPSVPRQSRSPVQLPSSADDQLSTPSLTPGSGNSDTTRSHSPSTFAHQPQPYHITVPSSSMPGLIDPTLASVHDSSPQRSSFTAELPQETKLLANIDLGDPMAGAFFGIPGDMSGLPHTGMETTHFAAPVNPMTADPAAYRMKGHHHQHHQQQAWPMLEEVGYFNTGLHSSNRFAAAEGFSGHNHYHHHEGSRIGTPGGGDGDSWDAWVNTEELGKLEAEAR